MPSFNKVILMGNLTRDPQLSYLPSNTPVVEIGLAINRRFKKQDGTQGEEVLFIDCRTFGKTAEVINNHFKKGDPILVEGRLQLDQWNDKDGNKKMRHRVHIDTFEFVAGKAEPKSTLVGKVEKEFAPTTQVSSDPAGEQQVIPF